MAGISTLVDPGIYCEHAWLDESMSAIASLLILTVFVWLLPNTQDWLRYSEKDKEATWITWEPATYWAIFNGIAAVFALSFMIGRPESQEFLYFQF